MMFGIEDSALIETLEAMRQQRCGYAPGGGCDCKFGWHPGTRPSSEQTGCPELRQAITILRGQRDEIVRLRDHLELTAVNTLAQIRVILGKHYAEVTDAAS